MKVKGVEDATNKTTKHKGVQMGDHQSYYEDTEPKPPSFKFVYNGARLGWVRTCDWIADRGYPWLHDRVIRKMVKLIGDLMNGKR